MLHKEISDKIINAYYKVYYKMGYGFLEKIFDNRLKKNLVQSN